MTDLKSKLARALAFDKETAYRKAGYGGHFVNGAAAEHARLRPILDSLSECVEAADAMREEISSQGGSYTEVAYLKAIQRLAEKLGGCE